MSERDQLPSQVEDKGRDIFNHPAFGIISMSLPTGGSGVLFGSDINHRQCVSIEIHRAEQERGLSRDWNHRRELVASIEMSHSQFAQFITSGGNGQGTPCTIRYAAPQGSSVEKMPGIQQIETKGQTFRREIQEASSEQVFKMQSELDRLGEMIDGGKVSKVELKAIYHAMKCQVENLPQNMAYVVGAAEEAVEKIVSQARIDVESYAQSVATRMGLESIREIKMLDSSLSKKVGE